MNDSVRCSIDVVAEVPPGADLMPLLQYVVRKAIVMEPAGVPHRVDGSHGGYAIATRQPPPPEPEPIA